MSLGVGIFKRHVEIKLLWDRISSLIQIELNLPVRSVEDMIHRSFKRFSVVRIVRIPFAAPFDPDHRFIVFIGPFPFKGRIKRHKIDVDVLIELEFI